MADIEKVINGVEHCFHGQECCGDIECPYYIEHLSDCCCLQDCQENLKADVIELLKEPEPVKLKTIDTDDKQYSFWFICGNCGWKIYKVVDDENCEDRKQIHFCASCGKPVRWGND